MIYIHLLNFSKSRRVDEYGRIVVSEGAFEGPFQMQVVEAEVDPHRHVLEVAVQMVHAEVCVVAELHAVEEPEEEFMVVIRIGHDSLLPGSREHQRNRVSGKEQLNGWIFSQ